MTRLTIDVDTTEDELRGWAAERVIALQSVAHSPLIPLARAILAALPDPEPPVGSVVLDGDGDAWQRAEDGRWWLTRVGSPLTWEELNEGAGPLRVIHTPEVEQ